MPESISQSVGSKFVTKVATFTRPADVNAYAVGDVVSNSASASVLMQFGPGLVRLEGGSGLIIKARLETDKNNELAQYRLFLYTKSEGSVTVPNDNAADTTLYADRTKKVGYIDFPACSAAAGTDTGSVALWTGGVGSSTAPSGPLPFVCDNVKVNTNSTSAAETSLYGKLVNITGTTPASGQNFWIELTVQQN